MSGLTFKMILSLVDRASANANKIANNVERMASRSARALSQLSSRGRNALVNTFRADAIERGLSRAESRIHAARGRLMDAAAMASIVIAPVLRIGRFEHQARHFGNVADMTVEQIQKIKTRLRETAGDTNQMAGDLLEGLNFLMGKGLSENVAQGAIEQIGKASTATGASVEHMSAASFAVIKNLKIETSQLGKALDMMAMSGKLGGFELKDMAQYFPAITASAKNLGIEGTAGLSRLTAALQVAITGASDPAQAANNFNNFLVKMTSPETVNKFKKMGIDIRKEMDNAAKAGQDPMEYMLVRMHDLAEQNKHVIGDVFGDMQVQAFLKPLIANLEEYRKFRDQTLTAEGVIDQDYNNVMDTMVERWKSFVIELDNATSAGDGLAGVIKSILISLTNTVREMNAFAKAHPELVGWMVKATAAALMLGVAAKILGYAWALTGGMFWRTIQLLRLFGITAAGTTALLGRLGKSTALFAASLAPNKIKSAIMGFMMLAQTIGGTGAVFTAIKSIAVGAMGLITAVSWPVVAVLALVAGAVFTIYKYWDRLTSFLSGVGSGLYDAFKPEIEAIGQKWDQLKTRILDVVGNIAQSLGVDAEAAKAAFASMFDFSGILESLAGIKDKVSSFFSDLFKPEELTDGQQAEINAMGQRLGKMLGDALRNSVTALADIGTAITDAIFEGLQAGWAKIENWLSSKMSGLTNLLPDSWNPFSDDEKATPPPSQNDNDPRPDTDKLQAYKPLPIPQNQNQQASEEFKAGLAQLSALTLNAGQGQNQIVEVPQSVDQSKHVQQTNHISVIVNGAPASAGHQAAGSLKAATNQALRDSD